MLRAFHDCRRTFRHECSLLAADAQPQAWVSDARSSAAPATDVAALRATAVPILSGLDLRDIRHSYLAPNHDSIDVLAGIDLQVKAISRCGSRPQRLRQIDVVHIVAGLLAPSSGDVKLNGQAITGVTGNVA